MQVCLSGRRSIVHPMASLSRREQLMVRLSSSTEFTSFQLSDRDCHPQCKTLRNSVVSRCSRSAAVLHARISDCIWISSSRRCWMKIVVACESLDLLGRSRFEQTDYGFANTFAVQNPVRLKKMVQKTVAVPQVQGETGRVFISIQNSEYRERPDECSEQITAWRTESPSVLVRVRPPGQRRGEVRVVQRCVARGCCIEENLC